MESQNVTSCFITKEVFAISVTIYEIFGTRNVPAINFQGREEISSTPLIANISKNKLIIIFERS